MKQGFNGTKGVPLGVRVNECFNMTKGVLVGVYGKTLGLII